jgi:hypothetical protein
MKRTFAELQVNDVIILPEGKATITEIIEATSTHTRCMLSLPDDYLPGFEESGKRIVKFTGLIETVDPLLTKAKAMTRFNQYDEMIAEDSQDYITEAYSVLDPIQEMANDDGCSRAEMLEHLNNPKPRPAALSTDWPDADVPF